MARNSFKMGNQESREIHNQQNNNARVKRKPFSWLCTNNKFVDNNHEFDLERDNPSFLL